MTFPLLKDKPPHLLNLFGLLPRFLHLSTLRLPKQINPFNLLLNPSNLLLPPHILPPEPNLNLLRKVLNANCVLLRTTSYPNVLFTPLIVPVNRDVKILGFVEIVQASNMQLKIALLLNEVFVFPACIVVITPTYLLFVQIFLTLSLLYPPHSRSTHLSYPFLVFLIRTTSFPLCPWFSKMGSTPH